MYLEEGGILPIEEAAAVLSNLPDFVVVVEDTGRIVYANEAARDVVGYGPDDLIGETLGEYVHADDHEAVLTALEDGLEESGSTTTVEYRFAGASGEYCWLESRGRTLPVSDASEVRVVFVLRDVTERRQRERQVTQQNDRLDSFAAVLSHDLQTPLSVASGCLDIYRENGDESALERVDAAHRRMGDLISDLLRLAREGNIVDDPEPVSLSDCVRSAIETSPIQTDSVTVDEELPVVTADDTRLQSLFENLFSNVAEHAGPSPHVWVGPLPDDGFFVEDDGPGIPPEETEAVFELGQSSARNGTGIGLHVVEAIAEAHGWDVSITTGRAGGARFEVRGVEGTADASDESGTE